jgi:hypothetical protein
MVAQLPRQRSAAQIQTNILPSLTLFFIAPFCARTHAGPSCWPSENKACMCFAAIGFCEPPAKIPTESRCQQLCPDCKSPTCKCSACWPGKGLNQTCDHTCECFAQLGFCEPGKEPVYTPGKICPSCWPSDNHACDCFAGERSTQRTRLTGGRVRASTVHHPCLA